MDQLTQVKVITLVVLFVASVIASFLPWILAKKLKKTAYLFSLLNCLSGGVVLGSGLSHMLVDSSEGFRTTYGADSYPYAEMICGGTLILLYVIEKIALSGAHSHSEITFDEESPILKASSTSTASEPAKEANKSAGHSHVVSETEVHNRHSHEKEHHIQVQDVPSDVNETINACDVNKNMAGIEEIGEDKRPDTVQAIVFLLALSVHSLFEGLGTGAEQTDSGLYRLLAAVASHKLLEAFALGLAIYRARFTLWVNFIILIGYALATPIGIIIGMFVAVGDNAVLISSILVSVAAGSFLYIAVIEILPTELNKHTSRKRLYPKLALMGFGWGFMAFIALYA